MALPVVRLSIVDAHRVVAVADPRSASFTVYGFLKAAPPRTELDACYADFARGVRAAEGGGAMGYGALGAAGGGGSAAMRRVMNNTFRTAQSAKIVTGAEAVAAEVFSKPPPPALHPLGLSPSEGRYLVEGSKGSDAAAQERRKRIFQNFFSGRGSGVSAAVGGGSGSVVNNAGGGLTSPFAETRRPRGEGVDAIANEHFSHSPFSFGAASHQSQNQTQTTKLGERERESFAANGDAAASSTPAGRPLHGGGSNAASLLEGLESSAHHRRAGGISDDAAIGGNGITITRRSRSEEDAAILATMRRDREGAGAGASPAATAASQMYGGASEEAALPERSPSQRLNFAAAESPRQYGQQQQQNGLPSPQQQGAQSSSLPHTASASSKASPYLAAVLRDIDEGVGADGATLSSRDLAARNAREVWGNNAIDLFARIASVRVSAGGGAGDGSPTEATAKPVSGSTANSGVTSSSQAAVAAICDGLAARLRRVQLFHLLQRHEEETLQTADLALRAECEAMKRQLRDVISALVRSEGRLTGEDESLPPSDGRYVSEHFLFEQIQDVLQEASTVV